MGLTNFIKQYNIEKIKKLEQNDPQFLALEKARSNIKNKDENLFLFLIIQCALVWYQISGSWEKRRTEFGEKITKDRQILKEFRQKNKSNTDRRYNFLTNSKHNKRIYNIKINRLKKFDNILQEIDSFFWHKDKIILLQEKIANIMKTSKSSKTVTFSIKMFGYWIQTITKINFIYPMDITIPIDSRLKKIYLINNGSNQKQNRIDAKEIQKYFQKLSKFHQIPPLHLDSILRIDYRKLVK